MTIHAVAPTPCSTRRRGHDVRTSTSRFLAALGLTALAACTRADAAHSSAAAVTFDSARVVSGSTAAVAAPTFAVGPNGSLYALWVVGKDVPGRRIPMSALRFARSDDGGRTFGAPIPVGVAEYSRPAHVPLALDASAPNGTPTVVLTWDDGTVQQPRVLVRVSRDDGSTFAPAVVASLPARAATFPVLAAGGGRVTIAWSENTAFAAAEAEHKMGHDDKTMHMPLPAVGNKSIVLRDGRI